MGSSLDDSDGDGLEDNFSLHDKKNNSRARGNNTKTSRPMKGPARLLNFNGDMDDQMMDILSNPLQTLERGRKNKGQQNRNADESDSDDAIHFDKEGRFIIEDKAFPTRSKEKNRKRGRDDSDDEDSGNDMDLESSNNNRRKRDSTEDEESDQEEKRN